MRKRTIKIISTILIMMLILGTTLTTVKAVDTNLDLERTTGSLKITKIQVENNEQRPLAGVTFDIYKVGDDEESTAIPTDGAILATKQSLTTGADGVVTFADLALGRYLVVESNAPANVVSKIANFLVDIPMTEPDGQTLNYDVEVSPKNNTVYGGFTLHKQDTKGNPMEGVAFELQKLTDGTWSKYNTENLVTAADGTITVTGLPAAQYRFVELSTLTGYILDNKTTYNFEVSLDVDGTTKVEPATITVINEKPELTKEITTTLTDGSAKIGDIIDYKLTLDVPSTISRLNTYKIEDTFGVGLTFNSASLVVKGIAGDLTETTLSAGTDYTANYDDAKRTETITFTNANLANYKKLEVTYNATVNRNADATNVGNGNNAKLTYSTIVDKDYNDNTNTETTDEDIDSKVVYTGGFWIEKRALNNAGELLQGAVFKIASSEANAKAGNYLTDENGDVITLTTDASGKVSYKGLTYGKYYLVEVEAPTYVEGEGADQKTKHYNLLRKPVEIEVTADTYAAGTPTAIVVNKKGFELPATGGMGTIVVTVIGVAVVVAGVVMVKKGKNSGDGD